MATQTENITCDQCTQYPEYISSNDKSVQAKPKVSNHSVQNVVKTRDNFSECKPKMSDKEIICDIIESNYSQVEDSFEMSFETSDDAKDRDFEVSSQSSQSTLESPKMPLKANLKVSKTCFLSMQNSWTSCLDFVAYVAI